MEDKYPNDSSHYEFDPAQPWSTTNHPWMRASQYMYEQLRAQDPTMPEVDDPDPMIRVFAARNGGRIPPRKFWDTPEMWEQAQAERMHPFTLWSIRSATAEEANDPEYIAWVEAGY